MTNIVTVSTCPPSSGSKQPHEKTKYDVETSSDFTCLKELADVHLVLVSMYLPSSGSKYPHQKTKYDVGTSCEFTRLKELAHEDLAI